MIQLQARIIIWRYKPSIVAVTGSVGKTGTKDAIYAIMSQSVHTRRSRKSFNSSIGVPLTILGVPTGWRDILKWVRNLLKGFWLIMRPWGKYPKWLILELGISKPGDMKELQRWVTPDVVVVTAFGSLPSHVEFFNSKEEVWKEESAIIDVLKKDGLLVLNKDDDEVMKLAHRAQDSHAVITYGFDEGADIFIGEYEYIYNDNNRVQGISSNIQAGDMHYPISLHNTLGKNFLYGLAAGIAVHNHILKPLESLEGRIAQNSFTPGRLSLIEGISESTLIDDSYNSSPPALDMAIDIFKEVECTGRKIAIVGDMLELGKHSDDAHTKAGIRLARCADYIISVGPRAKHITDAAHEYGCDAERLHHFQDSLEATKHAQNLVQAGDLVLVKGSQGVRMEHVVKGLMKNPDDAKNLLVRQEDAWIGGKG